MLGHRSLASRFIRVRGWRSRPGEADPGGPCPCGWRKTHPSKARDHGWLKGGAPRGRRAGQRPGRGGVGHLAGPSRICAHDDRDLSTERGSSRHVHATVGPASGRRDVRQRAGGCSGDEARQPGRGRPHRPSRAAQQNGDQGSRCPMTGAFAMSDSRTRSFEEPA